MRGSFGSRVLGQLLEALYHRVEQRAENARALGFKRSPEFRLGAAALSGIGSSVRKTSAVGEVGRSTMSSMPLRMTGRAASNSTSS